jgi:hypothetical protein
MKVKNKSICVFGTRQGGEFEGVSAEVRYDKECRSDYRTVVFLLLSKREYSRAYVRNIMNNIDNSSSHFYSTFLEKDEIGCENCYYFYINL